MRGGVHKIKPTSKKTINDHSIDEDGTCTDCGKEFLLVLRIDGTKDDALCMDCFSQRFGFISTQNVLNEISPEVQEAWRTEREENQIDFKKLNVIQKLEEQLYIKKELESNHPSLDDLIGKKELDSINLLSDEEKKKIINTKQRRKDVLLYIFHKLDDEIQKSEYVRGIDKAQDDYKKYIQSITDQKGFFDKEKAVNYAKERLRKVMVSNEDEKRHLNQFIEDIEDKLFSKNGKMKKLCPSCNKNHLKEPLSANALSRKDNSKYICSECGIREAYDKSTVSGINPDIFEEFINDVLPSNIPKDDPVKIGEWLTSQYLSDFPDKKWMKYFEKSGGSLPQLDSVCAELKQSSKQKQEKFKQMIIKETEDGLKKINRKPKTHRVKTDELRNMYDCKTCQEFVRKAKYKEKGFYAEEWTEHLHKKHSKVFDDLGRSDIVLDPLGMIDTSKNRIKIKNPKIVTSNGRKVKIGETTEYFDLPEDFDSLDPDDLALRWGESPEHIQELTDLCEKIFPITDQNKESFAREVIKINKKHEKIRKKKERYLSYEEARNWALQQKCHSRQDWINLTKTDSFPKNIPIHPETYYKEEFKRNGGFPYFCGFEVKVRRAPLTKQVLKNIVKEFGKRWLDYSLYPDALLTNWFETQGLFSVTDPYYKEFFRNFIAWRNDPEGIKALRYWIDTLDLTKSVGDFTLESKKKETKEEYLDRQYTKIQDVRVTPLLTERLPMGVEKIMLEAKSIVPDIEDKKWFWTQVNFNVQLLWYELFNAEEIGIDEYQKIKKMKHTGNKFHDTILDTFIEEYMKVKELNFGRKYYTYPQAPKLIQRYTAYKMRNKNFFFNMSSTGTYKTGCGIISAVASKVGHVFVICPKNIMEQWKKNIRLFYRDTYVSMGKEINPNFFDNAQKYKPRFHVINYDKFGREKGATTILDQIKKNSVIDFVIIDESHFIKNTNDDESYISNRRKYIEKLVNSLRAKNRNLKILMLTATPVVNNIREGKSLLEMGTGTKYNLSTYSTIRNATKLYTEFLPFSVNWIKNYDIEVRGGEKPIVVDAFIPETYSDEQIRNLGWNELEQIATKYRIPKILEILKKTKGKTVVYTDYVTGIVPQLVEAITNAGYKVGEFTGDEKSGLVRKTGQFDEHGDEKIFNDFVYGDTQVLIASRPFAVGVDEIQYACNNLIMNGLVWTWAQFEQIRGRVVRSGQTKDHVNFHMIFARINGFDYDQKIKYNRLLAKKALGDCIKTGTLPEKIKLGSTKSERLNVLENMIKNRETGFPDKERIESEYALEMQSLIQNKINTIEEELENRGL